MAGIDLLTGMVHGLPVERHRMLVSRSIDQVTGEFFRSIGQG